MSDIAEQIKALKTAGTAQLSTLYRRHFDDKGPPGNRTFLIRQLAHKIQEQTLGGISPAAKTRIQELIRRCTFRGHIT